MLNNLWIFIQFLIGFHLIFPLLLLVIYLLRPKRKRKTSVTGAVKPDYAIIVTAYEQTDLLPTVVDSLLQLRYEHYHIYIVADNCDIGGLSFPKDKVCLLRPEKVLASNTRSHFYAIHRFIRQHDRLTIIDSDNLVEPDYLDQLNLSFEEGYRAVQGLRLPANLDTIYSRLDAARDIYYHFYDGKLLFGAGSSATLSGSGMAFETSLYRACLEHQDITGAGFDKVLQAEIVVRKQRIAFNGAAIVYDRKTSKPAQLVAQRARWINTWFRYFKKGFFILGQGIKNANWSQLLYAIVLLRPPLFIFLGLSLICLTVNIVFAPMYSIVWAGALVLFIAGFMTALLMSDTDKRIYSALAYIPKFVFYQITALFKAKKANQISVATKHIVEKEPKSGTL